MFVKEGLHVVIVTEVLSDPDKLVELILDSSVAANNRILQLDECTVIDINIESVKKKCI